MLSIFTWASSEGMGYCFEGAACVVGDGGKADLLGTARPGVTEVLGSSAPWLPCLHLGDRGLDLRPSVPLS